MARLSLRGGPRHTATRAVDIFQICNSWSAAVRERQPQRYQNAAAGFKHSRAPTIRTLPVRLPLANFHQKTIFMPWRGKFQKS
jgi:hypothetical protein